MPESKLSTRGTRDKSSAFRRPLHSVNTNIHITIPLYAIHNSQGDHSPDNMKFPDNSMTFPW